MPAPPMPTPLNTSVIPLGERTQRNILEYVLAVGDEAETTYLEVKSRLDLSSKLGVAKIAKFLLGAANRRPREATHHFHGYAVMLIGARRGEALGVPRGVEAHELEDRLRPYLGPQFPAFEFGRIAVDGDREVLFVIAQPPQDGQTIFPCHKSFQSEDRKDNLDDGAVYVRGSSNTRPARAGEIQALVERARGGGKPPISLEVAILGSIGRVDRVDELMERLYDIEEEEFSAPPAPVQGTIPFPTLPPNFFGSTGPLSAEERAARLDAWKAAKDTHIARGRGHFLGAALPGVGIRVVSRNRFVAKPHLVVTFRGCQVFDFREAEDVKADEIVKPIVPRPSHYLLTPDIADFNLTPRDYPVAWESRGDDAEVMLTPESFRPNVPWQSDQDDFVLLSHDPRASSVSVTWSLTEDGNDEVSRGEFQVPAATLVDAVELYRTTFREGR